VSLHDLGDAPLIRYYLVDPSTVPPTPINGTVTAALTDPAGTTTPLTVSNPSTGIYTATPLLAAEGDWLLTFTTTAPVADVEQVRLSVLPSGTLHPAWEPALTHVAAHIPTRTRAVGVDDTYLMTFTADTTPTGDTVAVLIGHACARVLASVGTPVVSAAYPACQLAASLLAAYWVELGYPERDADVAVYDRLRGDFEKAIAAAQAVNAAAGGGLDVDPTPEDARPLTQYSFPDPVPYADVPFQF
jgi:hypothetical protein